MMMTPPRRQPSSSSPRAGKGSSGGTGTMNATVSLRLRPVISALDEEQGRRHSAVEVTDKDAGFAAYEGRQFKYSHVFDETASQADIFQAHRAPVLNVLKGFDATTGAFSADFCLNDLIELDHVEELPPECECRDCRLASKPTCHGL